MKIWFGYGSEHSSNLVIIGTFKTEDRAKEALRLINEATELAAAESSAGRVVAGEPPDRKLSDPVLDFLRKYSVGIMNRDLEELLYEFHARANGDKVVITTDEDNVNGLIKILLHGGAKIEVYSAHSHQSAYGRQTYNGA